MPMLIFICTLMGISNYEPFWQEVSVESLILRWPLRPLGLLLKLAQYALKSFFKCCVVVNDVPLIGNLPLSKTWNVPENTPLGRMLYRVTVNDLDATDVVQYDVIFNPTTGSSYFAVNRTSNYFNYPVCIFPVVWDLNYNDLRFSTAIKIFP